MNKINYALISALYDTKGADLYNDVYFPIVKYEVVNQYYTQIDTDKYYKLEDLQLLINTDFGIKIPLVVLKQSIKAIGNGHNGVELTVYEKGKSFKIRKAWDIAINQSIDTKAIDISNKFKELESLYAKYIKTENLSCDKSFIDFYSGHTNEVLNYFDSLDGGVEIDENYVNVTRFLDWIKNTNVGLFNIANDIFWGSVIAGFLKRDKADIEIKPTTKVEYFLDSALILAVLDLDSTENVAYSRELLEIIKSSGNIPMVHSMTIREVNSILFSVEKSQGPKANTAIESAYYRRKLTPSKILNIRNKLTSLIESKGIVVFPTSEKELDSIENEYRNKKDVKELEEFRHGNPSDSIRDVHDAFLYDFIFKKLGHINLIEKNHSLFISLNTDLISFYKEKYPNNIPLIIHPSKIVLDLWIHNSSSSIIRQNGLTEMMSRCYALNNTDIRRKLRLVSKYYKESDEQYSEDNYRAVYSALVNRSTKVINEVEAIELAEKSNNESKEEVINEHKNNLIKIAVEEETKNKHNTVELEDRLDRLSKELDNTNQLLLHSQDEISKNKSLMNDIQKQKRIAELSSSIFDISLKLSELEKEKEQSIHLLKYWLIIIFEIIIIVSLLISLGFLLTHIDFSKIYESFVNKTKAMIVFLLSALVFLCKVQNLYILSPNIHKQKCIEEQAFFWENQNPKYCELKKDLNKLYDERRDFNS